MVEVVQWPLALTLGWAGLDLDEAGGGKVGVAPDMVEVCDGACVGRVHGLADVGLLALHQPQLVHRVVLPQTVQLVPGQPLPVRGQRSGGKGQGQGVSVA